MAFRYPSIFEDAQNNPDVRSRMAANSSLTFAQAFVNDATDLLKYVTRSQYARTKEATHASYGSRSFPLRGDAFERETQLTVPLDESLHADMEAFLSMEYQVGELLRSLYNLFKSVHLLYKIPADINALLPRQLQKPFMDGLMQFGVTSVYFQCYRNEPTLSQFMLDAFKRNNHGIFQQIKMLQLDQMTR